MADKVQGSEDQPFGWQPQPEPPAPRTWKPATSLPRLEPFDSVADQMMDLLRKESDDTTPSFRSYEKTTLGNCWFGILQGGSQDSSVAKQGLV